MEEELHELENTFQQIPFSSQLFICHILKEEHQFLPKKSILERKRSYWFLQLHINVNILHIIKMKGEYFQNNHNHIMRPKSKLLQLYDESISKQQLKLLHSLRQCSFI